MKYWDWSDTFLALCAIVVCGVLGIGVYALFQDHTIRFYYMSDHGSGMSHNGYCVDGYRTWWPNDYGVFCSDDVNKTITVMKEMNQALLVNKKISGGPLMSDYANMSQSHIRREMAPRAEHPEHPDCHCGRVNEEICSSCGAGFCYRHADEIKDGICVGCAIAAYESQGGLELVVRAA